MELEINKEVADITKCTRAALAFDYLAFCEKDYLVWCPLPASELKAVFPYIPIGGAIKKLLKHGLIEQAEGRSRTGAKCYHISDKFRHLITTTNNISFYILKKPII